MRFKGRPSYGRPLHHKKTLAKREASRRGRRGHDTRDAGYGGGFGGKRHGPDFTGPRANLAERFGKRFGREGGFGARFGKGKRRNGYGKGNYGKA